MDIHGLWIHFTLHNIHINMDMVPCLYSYEMLHTFHIKIDLFKIGTLLVIIIQGF